MFTPYWRWVSSLCFHARKMIFIKTDNQFNFQTTPADISRRNLKGIAGGVAHQFNCSTNYYAFQAVANNQPQIRINLQSLDITPDLFNVERNRILARMDMG